MKLIVLVTFVSKIELKVMRPLAVLCFIILIGSVFANAQTRTINGSGNWSDSGNWLGGNIGGDVDNDDDVVMANNIDITIQNTETYTIATLNVSKDGSLTIDLGGVLIVTGTVTVDKDFTINVDGDLTIEGNLDVAKSLQLNVTGNLTVKGDLNAAKDAQMDIQGSVTVEGDFTTAKDTQVNVDGSLDVDGTITTGSGSTLTGTGVVTAGGGCTGEPVFCAGAPLPVELIYFNAKVIDKNVVLSWATASEENFDYFSVERSPDGANFKEIAQINGAGNSMARLDYEYFDVHPLKGLNYYRLTSIDFDGYTEVFEYALVNIDNIEHDFIVFPNPVEGGVFSLQMNFVPEAPLDLVIYNNVGRVEGQYKVTDWHNTFKTNNLQSGSYLIKLATPAGVLVKRILLR